MNLYSIPPDQVRAWRPHVADHLRRACERGVGDISAETLLEECEGGFARLLIVSDGACVPAAAVARFCGQVDGSLACELAAAGGGSLASWKHVVPEFEAWARFHGARTVRLCGRPGWERVFRGYRRRPLVSLVKEL